MIFDKYDLVNPSRLAHGHIPMVPVDKNSKFKPSAWVRKEKIKWIKVGCVIVNIRFLCRADSFVQAENKFATCNPSLNNSKFVFVDYFYTWFDWWSIHTLSCHNVIICELLSRYNSLRSLPAEQLTIADTGKKDKLRKE